MKRRQIYAVYRGEKNLGDGTAEELEKKLAISKKKIYALCSPYVHKRDKGQQLVVIKLGKEEV
ncbi:hypothetical protein M8868_10415 [Pasteurella multocida]|uniref:Uncharacterized protein n=1 Tax=Pasteurella multocida TaxID=747 RepID=A0AAW8V9A5_PASMD|nr:hypothetical protein [Pasteurella multocida]ARA69633.1 hypothetical protein BTV67_03500 [Pasteurella multocida subsp. multocida]ARA70818.1 hypothetical protein BTV67_09985 [Pasteurella multocida subsp. multocida]ARA88729.1 hypothetical protein BTV66_03515 [Pasteurella multocida subsp. septica]ARA90180.1 hypothetical protein BTV66_11545 [Pasteurella multocida subsp. septica]AUK50055.1 hypothetical protein A4210_10080 [Pasteurella multocida]